LIHKVVMFCYLKGYLRWYSPKYQNSNDNCQALTEEPVKLLAGCGSCAVNDPKCFHASKTFSRKTHHRNLCCCFKSLRHKYACLKMPWTVRLAQMPLYLDAANDPRNRFQVPSREFRTPWELATEEVSLVEEVRRASPSFAKLPAPPRPTW